MAYGQVNLAHLIIEHKLRTVEAKVNNGEVVE